MVIFWITSSCFLLYVFVFTRRMKTAPTVWDVLSIPLLLLIISGIFPIITNLIVVAKKTDLSAIAAPEYWYDKTPFKHILLFLIMLFGMTTRYLVDYLQARIKAKEEKGKIRKMPEFIWEKFFLPFILSFLIFGILWKELGQESIGFVVVFSCYQNGFFWQNLLVKAGA